VKFPVSLSNRLEAADLLYREAQRLKPIARTSDLLTAPMLWLKIKDLETLARFLESTDLLSDTQTPGRL
jgi:hypothetical protein